MPHMFSDVRAFRRDPLQFLLARGNAAPLGLVPLYLGPSPVLLVNDPDLIRPILKAPETEVGKGQADQEADAGARPEFVDVAWRGAQAAARRAAEAHGQGQRREIFAADVRRNPCRSAPGSRVLIVRSASLHGNACAVAPSALRCSARR